MIAQNLKNLVEKGKLMRKAQKDYFKMRLKSDLIKSKELEKDFDYMMEKCEEDGFSE